MNLSNYQEKNVTVSAGKAQILGLLLALPIVLVLLIPYYQINRDQIGEPYFSSNFFGYLSVIGAILFGVIAHELTHGLTWAYFCKDGFKSIRFGVIWKYLTPYCHCKEVLLKRHYIIGAIMPAILVGLIPTFVGYLFAYKGLFLFGLFFTFGAGGDFLIIWLLRKFDAETLVLDHPSQIGCLVYEPK